MPDHVHAILTPQPTEAGTDWSVSQIVHSLKGYSAHKIDEHRQRKGSVWQRGFYERVIRSEADLRQKVQYVWENPLRAGLVWEPDLNAHTWNRWYHAQESLG